MFGIGKDKKKKEATKKVTKKETAATKDTAVVAEPKRSTRTKSTSTKAAAVETKVKAPAPVSKPSEARTLEPTTKFAPYQATKTEAYMNDKQRVHFSNILNAWKRELMEEVDETISELKEASTSVLADPNDRATQEETFSLELRTRDRERKLIKKIEEALQKIKDKEYGYCDACGIEIGIRRLEARPTANLCIDCKTLAEIKEKRA